MREKNDPERKERKKEREQQQATQGEIMAGPSRPARAALVRNASKHRLEEVTMPSPTSG